MKSLSSAGLPEGQGPESAGTGGASPSPDSIKKEIDAATQAVFDQGHAVGDLAKALYPGGVEGVDTYEELMAHLFEQMIGAFAETYPRLLRERATTSPEDALFAASSSPRDGTPGRRPKQAG